MLGLGTEDLVIIGAAAGVFVIVLALALASSRDARVAARIKAVSNVSGQRSSGAATPRETGTKAAVGVMRNTVGRFNLVGSKQSRDAVDRLARAGWRSKDALIIYLFSRLTLPIFAGGMALIAFYGLEVANIEPVFRLIVVMVCTIAGFMLPNVFVSNMQSRRRKNLLKATPDMIDLMVICTEAGLSLDATISRVAREIYQASPEMADELTVTSSELAYLAERQQALDNWRRRVDLPAIQALCTTLLQTEKFGTPLAQALRVLALEQRDERMLRAEEKAARLPAIMTIPLITCILPSLFVVVIGPAILNVMDALMKM
jgi:tight adherence protein C